jgi:hemolysin activation/secretion protein
MHGAFTAKLSRICASLLVAATLDALAQQRNVVPQPEPLPAPKFLPQQPPGIPFQLPPLEAAPPEVKREGAQVLVGEVRFEGNTVITTLELQKIAAPYAGRQLYAADIEELRRALTQHYIDRGYVNSGALLVTGAAAKPGVLVFRIVEGKVSRVQVRGLERLNERYVTGRLVPRADEPLNLNVLRERFQLLLDDPLFARINTRVMPGENAGDAVLDLDVVRARPYQLTVFSNNYRSPSIGEIAAGLSGNVRNLTGFGDLLDFRWYETLQSQRSDSYSLGWRVPVTRYGTAVSLRADRGQSIVVEAPLTALNITSKIDSVDAGISHPFIETLKHKLTLGVNYVDETVKSSILGIPFSFTAGVPAGETQARVWRFWQEYSYRSETNAVVLRSTFNSENNNQEAAGAATIQAPSSYRYWLGQYQYAQRFGDKGIQTVLKGAVQRTNATLLPIDAISVGGVYSVRGYRENQFLGDKGELASLQLDVPLPTGGNRFPQVVASPFFDWGRASNTGLNSNILSSGGLALRAAWKGARADFVIAKRFKHDAVLDKLSGSLQDDRIHFQLAYDFF